jgi:hypothetical protein
MTYFPLQVKKTCGYPNHDISFTDLVKNNVLGNQKNLKRWTNMETGIARGDGIRQLRNTQVPDSVPLTLS